MRNAARIRQRWVEPKLAARVLHLVGAKYLSAMWWLGRLNSRKHKLRQRPTDELDRLVAAGKIRDKDRERVRFIVRTNARQSAQSRFRAEA